ncbi:MAG: hypothetical protein A2X36_15845 [Elusimicrobia bacterium GWA2_69_24]|nr:MAG: hypothetical protein A2X36_15845 [Elusimicrobia bacterium GWA2_69_24]
MKILFVCTGNTCRSVMAEFLLRKLAADRGLAGWEARSNGVAAEGYFKIPSGVRTALADRGIAQVAHTPELVGRDAMTWADLVVPMTRAHRDHLTDQYPEFGSKIKLFLELAGKGAGDVADPIGQSDAVYRRCRDELEQGLGRIIDAYAAEKDRNAGS